MKWVFWREQVFCKKMFFIVVIMPICFMYFYLANLGDSAVANRQRFDNYQSSNFISSSLNETGLRVKKSKDEDFDRRASYPWPNDPKCSHFSVQLAARNSFPKWPLTSFPGSGVTWTRQIIEGVTGIYTGSVYQNDPLPVKPDGNQTLKEVDDPLCGCTILDKEHEATLNYNSLPGYFTLLHRQGHAGLVAQQYFNKGVLLLRNPMDVVFTYRNWLTNGKVGTAPPDAFKGPKWDEVIDYVSYAWADHAIRWIEQINEGTVLFYEHLKGKHAAREIERLLTEIHFGPIDPDRMYCALAHRDRTDHKRVNKTWMPLEPHHRMKLMKSIHQVQQSLRRKMWPALPIYLYDLHSEDGIL